MNRGLVNIGSLRILDEELSLSFERHKKRYGEQIKGLTNQVEKEYATRLEQVLSLLLSNKDLAEILMPVHYVLKKYLSSMRWVGWGDCEFGPPLNIQPVKEFSHAILIYLSARLIDDGIDGHKDYKGRVLTLYGFLTDKMSDREAAGLSSMMGNLLLNASLRLLNKQGYTESADVLMRIYADVIPGALAEALSRCSVNYSLYQRIIKHKSVAYDMMLHQVFLRQVIPSLRFNILHLLADLSETAQWLNDLCDDEDDQARNQLNILRISRMNRYVVFGMVAHSLQKIWQDALVLPSNIRDAMANRLKDLVRLLIQSAESV